MGEAGRRQKNRAKFLSEHKWCVHCGDAATTTDHCPPRTFFLERCWPETYEFPACSDCNSETRLDEQALAVLIRLRNDSSDFAIGPGGAEWKRLLDGVKNNQPKLIAEWNEITPTERKRFFRDTFGSAGDQMRYEGWGALHLGPLSHAAIRRFMVKLGRSLYYRHNNRLFEGALYTRHINIITEKDPDALIDSVLSIAPELSVAKRNNQGLEDQFAYRFNYSPEHGAFYSVVRFSAQFIFQLVAMSFDMAEKLESSDDIKRQYLTEIRYDCRLKQKPFDEA